MDVEGESLEVSVSKRNKIASLPSAGRRVNVLMQTAMMATLVSATLLGGEVYEHLSGELLDPLLVHEGREKERENLRKFEMCERVPRHQAVGKRVRVQWLNVYDRNVDESVCVRSRLVAKQIA